MWDATALLRLYARWRHIRLAAERTVSTQQDQLRRLVADGAKTRFGRDHDLDRVDGVTSFQSRVPLRGYDAFWQDYWSAGFPHLIDCTWPGTVPFFAETSGTTTGKTKYIPWTLGMNRANVRAGLDLLVHHVANRPQTRLLGGRSFMLGGSPNLIELAPGIRSGDLSGIAAATLPWWVGGRHFPPQAINAIDDWETKIEQLAQSAVEEDIRLIGGIPSWVLILFDRLAARHPESGRRLVDYFPNLELIVHGGVNFAPYRAIYGDWLAGSHAETREVYVASEGFFAVADRGDGEGLRLITDNGLFYEFVPVDELGSAQPKRHWLGTAETGVDYAIAVTSCAGLWAYLVGDTVSFVEREPPRLLVTGRITYSLSAFGEHLIDAEIEQAVAGAAAAIGARVVDYSVGPIFPELGGGRGGHLFVVEFAVPVSPAAVSAFAGEVDHRLQETNADYRSHRAGRYGLLPPRIHAVGPGTFAAWMKRRGKLGAQNKVPRVINDTALFSDLRRYTGADGAPIGKP